MRSKKPLIIALAVCLSYAALSFLLYFAGRLCPAFVTKVYTKRLYKVLTLPCKAIAALFPFSVSEILLILVILSVIIGTIVCFLLKKQRFLLIIPCVLSVIAGNFVWLGGMNYNALSFKEIAGCTTEKHDVNALRELCIYLEGKASEYRRLLNEDGEGVITSDKTAEEILSLSKEGFSVLANQKQYGEFFKGFTVTPKPAIFSEIMSYEQISGIFPIVYTESIVNVNTPLTSLPHTACHEITHQYGFMREDEANFLAFVACINNSDPLYIYSGYYSALVSALNRLYTYDKEAWKSLIQAADRGILRDMRHEQKVWETYEKKAAFMATLSENVNNAYLQANNIKDGTYSYGRMVDLLLWYWENNISFQ